MPRDGATAPGLYYPLNMETLRNNLSTCGAVGAVALSYSDAEQVLRCCALVGSIAWTCYNFYTATQKPKGKK